MLVAIGTYIEQAGLINTKTVSILMDMRGPMRQGQISSQCF